MKLKVAVNGAPAGVYDVSIISLTPKLRFQKSVQLFCIFFLASLGSVFIPVLHFVLVPALLITAFVMAFKKYHEVATLNLQSFHCPHCKKDLREQKVSWSKAYDPVRIYCSECRSQLSLEPEI